jgi:hypothetical protein
MLMEVRVAVNHPVLLLTVKDKAEALFEVDKLRRVKDELSTEVSSLHAQLEQERSKVRALTSDSKTKAQVTLRYFTVNFSIL